MKNIISFLLFLSIGFGVNLNAAKKVLVFIQYNISSLPAGGLVGYLTGKLQGFNFVALVGKENIGKVGQHKDAIAIFYALQQSSRLETVDLDKELMQSVQQKLPNKPLVIIALRPGDPKTTPAAEAVKIDVARKIQVITLWFTPHAGWDEKDNLDSIKLITAGLKTPDQWMPPKPKTPAEKLAYLENLSVSLQTMHGEFENGITELEKDLGVEGVAGGPGIPEIKEKLGQLKETLKLLQAKLVSLNQRLGVLREKLAS